MDAAPAWRARMVGDLGSIDGLRIVIPQITSNALKQLVQYGERVAKQKAPKDTTGLAQSIGSDVQGFSGVLIVPFGAEVDRIGQAVTMEFGRAPGQPMPPSGVLLNWMRRHGIPEKAEFVLRRSIGKKGIKGFHYMQAAADAMVRNLPIIVQQAAHDLERRVGRH